MRNRSKYRTWVSAALTAAAIMLTPTTALAASLSAMSLRITQSGSTIDVEKYASGSAYSVQSASVSDDTLTIKVYAGSGNSWSSKLTKAKVNLYGNLSSSDVESVSRSGSVLTVKVTLPDDAATSATSSKSSSSSSSGSSSKSTSSSKSSGSSSSTKSKVTVKKNALASSSSSSSSKKSSTSASGNSSDEDVEANAISDAPMYTGYGWWIHDQEGLVVFKPDRSYTVSNWQLIGNKWYYFNEYGYMKTGWVNLGGTYYYLGEDGAMLTSQWTPDGYYVGSDGHWYPALGHKTTS